MSDTSGLGDCFLNQNDCWRIRYSVPRPKRIRYQYPLESPQEIEASRYTLEQSSGQGGESVALWYLYDLRVSVELILFGNPTGVFYQAWHGTRYTFWGLRSFTGRLLSVQLVPSTRFLATLHIGFMVEIRYIDAGGQVQAMTVETSGSNIQAGGGWWETFTSRAIVTFQLSTNPGQPPPSSCTLKIFDLSGQEVINRNSPACPVVTEIPCTNDGQTLRDIFIKPKNRLLGVPAIPALRVSTIPENGKVCRLVELVYYLPVPIFLFTRIILKICSPDGCSVPPYIEYNCKDKCDCEQCPPETCVSCVSNGVLCCFDGNGTVIHRVLLSPDCIPETTCK